MEIETRSNGSIQIHMQPKTAIETAYIQTMLEGAEKGRAVRLIRREDGAAIVEMDA